MSVTQICQWRIFCNTENAWSVGFGPAAPQTCYNNNSHSVNLLTIEQLSSFSPNTVVIDEQTSINQTGGRYGSIVFTMNVTGATGAVTSQLFSVPHPITMMDVQLQVGNNNVGDTVDCTICPNTTVGMSTVDSKIGDTTFNVDNTSIANLYLGVYVNITDGINNDNLGRVTAIGSSTVITELSPSHAYTAGSYIQITRYMVKDCYLAVAGYLKLGYGKVGGAYMPAGIPGGIVYTNTTGGNKVISLIMEYLY